MTPAVAPRSSGEPSLSARRCRCSRPSQAHGGRRAPQHPPGAAIASAHALATDAGFEAIRDGGNAFDAAVAVSAVLSVVEPISSGIGGGGFFLLHDAKTGRDVFVDARETAPAVGDARGLSRQGRRTRPRPRRERPVVGRHSRLARRAGAHRSEVRHAAADDHAGAGDPHRARRLPGLSAAGTRLRQPPRSDGALSRHARGVPRRRRRRRRPARSSSSPTSRARWSCWPRRASTASTRRSRREAAGGRRRRRRQVDRRRNWPATACANASRCASSTAAGTSSPRRRRRRAAWRWRRCCRSSKAGTWPSSTTRTARTWSSRRCAARTAIARSTSAIPIS